MFQAIKFSHTNIWVTAGKGYVPGLVGPGKGARSTANFLIYKQTNPRQMLGSGKFI